jgi:hypothetical protein
LPVGMGLPTGVVTGIWVGRVANCASSACACGMAFEFVVADVELPAPEVEVELLALDELDELDEQAARSSSADVPIVATAVHEARRLVPQSTDTVTPVDWHEVVETPAGRRFAGSYQPIDRLATRQTPRPLAGQRQGAGHDPPAARRGEGTPPDEAAGPGPASPEAGPNN